MLHVELHKRFSGDRRFCLDVCFSADSGKGPVVFFGASGSGKSLTLHCIAGLLRPDAGCVRLGRRTLYDSATNVFLPPRERRVGFMFQDYAIFPHLTVLQNVAYGLTGLFPGRVGRARREQVMPLLEMLDIGDLAERMPAQISGGQRQRVALARALSMQPDILLLDEPFSALDPLLRQRLRGELRELLDRLRLPTVVISHDPEDVTAFADTLVVYNKGRATMLPDFARTSLTGAALCRELIRLTHAE